MEDKRTLKKGVAVGRGPAPKIPPPPAPKPVLGTCDNDGVDHSWQRAPHYKNFRCINWIPEPSPGTEPTVSFTPPPPAIRTR